MGRDDAVRIGVVGCGAIGRAVARAVDAGTIQRGRLSGLHDVELAKATALAAALSSHPPCLSLDDTIQGCDLVMEATSAESVRSIVRKSLEAGRGIVVMSVGGLLSAPELLTLAVAKQQRLYLPSGALCGLDGLKAAALGEIRRVVLTTRKPPAAFQGAPYVERHRIDVASLDHEMMLFEGSPSEAVEGFPQNLNVSATVCLGLGVSPEKMQIRIFTGPQFRTNSHELYVEGSFGSLTARTENVPSPENPKTSALAALSAIATLKEALGYVRIGT